MTNHTADLIDAWAYIAALAIGAVAWGVIIFTVVGETARSFCHLVVWLVRKGTRG